MDTVIDPFWGHSSVASQAESSSTSFGRGEPVPCSCTSKNSPQQANNPQLLSALSPIPRYHKCYDRFQATFVCSDWLFLVRKEPFAICVWSLQLGSSTFQCWRWVVKYSMYWILWLECKHFSAMFWRIGSQVQFKGTIFSRCCTVWTNATEQCFDSPMILIFNLKLGLDTCCWK